MLPSPARIILQAVQAFLLVGLRPATDRLFIHEENVGGLPVTVAFGHQQQCVIALPLVTIEFLVFVTSRSFQEVLLAQHCASFFQKMCSTRQLYSVSICSTSWCAGHIGRTSHAGRVRPQVPRRFAMISTFRSAMSLVALTLCLLAAVTAGAQTRVTTPKEEFGFNL